MLKADLVLHEGQILGHPESDSLAVGDGRIIAHGPFSELQALVGPRTHLLKLSGRTVAPGLIDSHLHFLEAASALSGLTLWRCRSVADLLAELRVAAGRTPPGNWLRAFGCDEALLKERRGPTREELDAAVTRNPLRLRHQTLHGSWLNSRAIAALGLEQPAFLPPEGAMLVRDATGRLTGLVCGMEEWITQRLPPVTAAELEARARLLSRELAAAGVTAFTDASATNGPQQVALFARLCRQGAIYQRVSPMVGAMHMDGIEEAAEAARGAGLKLAGVKFAHPALWESDALAWRVRSTLALGLDCAFHATEVEELEAALSAIEAATAKPPGPDTTAFFRVEHGGLIPPNCLERLAALGPWVVTNPGFIHYRGVKYATEPGLMPHLYRARSLLTQGLRLAGATDAPVTPPRPLAAVAAAVSRAAIEGFEIGPAEKLTTAEALGLFTTNAAQLARLAAGKIEPDCLADLIVLSADPLTLKPAELLNLQAEVTIVAGRVIYERGRPAGASAVGADLFSA